MIQVCVRGEMYYADLGSGVGSEQEGCRPVVIIQNDLGNKHSPTTIVAPVSCRIETKAELPTHYPIDAIEGLTRPSVVLLEQIRVIDKHRLDRKLGKLPDHHIMGIEKALKISVGLLPTPPKLTICLCRKCTRSYFGSGAFYYHRISKTPAKELCICCKKKIGSEYEIQIRKRRK